MRAAAAMLLLVTTAAHAEQPLLQLGIGGSVGYVLTSTQANQPSPPALESIYLRVRRIGLTAEHAYGGQRNLVLDYFQPLGADRRRADPDLGDVGLRWKLGRVWADGGRTGMLAAVAVSVPSFRFAQHGLDTPFVTQLELRATALPADAPPAPAPDLGSRTSRDYDVSWMIVYTMTFGLAWQ